MKNSRLFAALLLIFIISLGYSAVSFGEGVKGKKISFFSTRGEDDLFWSPFRDFMKSACDDLGMELNTYYAEGDHIRMIENVKQNLSGFYEKPDVIIFPNFKMIGKKILEMAEEAKVPVFVVNSGFQPEEGVGIPREKYKYWIGQLTPNDELAGLLLSNIIINRASEIVTGNELKVFAMEGNISDAASIERKKGLMKSLAKKKIVRGKKVILERVFSAKWSPETAGEYFSDMTEDYDMKNYVIWTASDGMAIGIMDTAKKLKLQNDVITGGVDWSAEGLEAVKDGRLYATMGGHFMEGGWAAVMVYDYLNGIDFKDDGLMQLSNMYPVTQKNVNEYLKKLTKENWSKIDFTKFSKKYNPGIKKYNFDIETVLGQIN